MKRRGGRSKSAATPPAPPQLLGPLWREYARRKKETHSDAERSALIEEFDHRFGRRADYWLSRSFKAQDSPPPATFESVNEAAEAGLGAHRPEIVWGTYAMLAVRLEKWNGRDETSDPMRSEMESLIPKLNPRCADHPEAAFSCRITRLLLLAVADRCYHEIDSFVGDDSYAENLLHRTCSCLERLDPDWRPGRAVRLDFNSGSQLLPVSPGDLLRRIGEALFRVRASVREHCAAATSWRNEFGEFLDRAAKLQFSGWRTIHSSRLWFTANSRRSGEAKALLKFELKALERACQAARDAGDFPLAGKLACVFLHLVPDANVADYEQQGRNMSGTVKESGLSVNKRFLSPSNPPPAELPRPRRREPFQLRLESEMEQDPDWAAVQRLPEFIPERPLFVLRNLAYSRVPPTCDDETLRAAFRLACRLRQIRTAGYLLGRLSARDLRLDELMTFSRLAAEGLHAMPLCAFKKFFKALRYVIRGAWGIVAAREEIPMAQLFALHEQQLGRGATLTGLIAEEHAEDIRRQMFLATDDADISLLLDGDVRFLTNPVQGCSIQDVRQGWPVLTQAAAARVAALSVTLVGEPIRICSVLWVDTSGHMARFEVSTPEFEPEAECEAFTTKRTMGVYPFWPNAPGIERLVRALAEQAASVCPDADFVMLAVDPKLATIPWQALLRQFGIAQVWTIIPSIEWLLDRALISSRADVPPARFSLPADRSRFATMGSEGPDPALSELAVEVQADAQRLRVSFPGGYFALGHGVWSQADERPIIGAAVPPMRSEDLFTMSRHPLVLIHACFGGRVVSSGIGDFGGFAGFCLSANTRLFIGPVTGVAAETAQALHRELLRADNPLEIGRRYLHAIQRDHRVAYYTLFGIPWMKAEA